MCADAYRKPTRLRGYDYRTPAMYHVVICTLHRKCWFGHIHEACMSSNAIGTMIDNVWTAIPRQFQTVQLDAFIVMPNHLHGLVFIEPRLDGAMAASLNDVIRWFKSMTTVRYSRGVRDLGWPPYDRAMWQRSYYDHIVRDDRDLERLRDYIEANPANWNTDQLFAEGQPPSIPDRSNP